MACEHGAERDEEGKLIPFLGCCPPVGCVTFTQTLRVTVWGWLPYTFPRLHELGDGNQAVPDWHKRYGTATVTEERHWIPCPGETPAAESSSAVTTQHTLINALTGEPSISESTVGTLGLGGGSRITDAYTDTTHIRSYYYPDTDCPERAGQLGRRITIVLSDLNVLQWLGRDADFEADAGDFAWWTAEGRPRSGTLDLVNGVVINRILVGSLRRDQFAFQGPCASSAGATSGGTFSHATWGQSSAGYSKALIVKRNSDVLWVCKRRALTRAAPPYTSEEICEEQRQAETDEILRAEKPSLGGHPAGGWLHLFTPAYSGSSGAHWSFGLAPASTGDCCDQAP